MSNKLLRQNAAQLREHVFDVLQSGGASSWQIYQALRKRELGRTVTNRQLEAALKMLRRKGRVRYNRPHWELVPPQEEP